MPIQAGAIWMGIVSGLELVVHAGGFGTDAAVNASVVDILQIPGPRQRLRSPTGNVLVSNCKSCSDPP
jgi:hypothetical protein